MKVFLYTEALKTVGKSGLGKAIEHQKEALKRVGVEYTLNRKDDYDIIHLNFYLPKSYLLAKRAKKKGKKVVYHAHSTEEDYINGFIFSKQTSKIFKWWLIKCYRLGDVIVTPTEYSKKILAGYPHLNEKKIYAISNGIDLSLFKRNKSLGKEFREKYHIKDKEKVIIGIGLYIERKGIVDFVELAKRLPQYKFIWFGYSPLSVATKKVRDAVNTKLDNLVFAGYVEQKEIHKALCGCDLYVFPTLEETEGIPIIEALACKTKAIVRDIPIFDDFLTDGVDCYKAKDVDEFEDKIKKILTEKLPDVSEAGYHLAKERSIESVGEKLKEVYEEVFKR